MFWKFLFINLMTVLMVDAALQPIILNTLRRSEDLKTTEPQWIWPSSEERAARGFYFHHNYHYDDYDDGSIDHQHFDGCHHTHHHGYPQRTYHSHLPRHRHHHYEGSMQYYRHRPSVYPPPMVPLAPFTPSTTYLPVQQPTRPPAPVYEENVPEDTADKNPFPPATLTVPLSPLTTSTTPTQPTTSTTTTARPTTSATPTTTSSSSTSAMPTSSTIPAFEKIDLRFGF